MLQSALKCSPPTTTQMNKHKAGGLNDTSRCLGQCKSFILVFVELFLLLTTCFSFRFLYIDYDIAHPLNNTQALHHCCEPLLAGWQWALFCPVMMMTTNAMLQHHHPVHPACKPLLIGRYGGADDDNQEGEWWTMNDRHDRQWEQQMMATTSDREQQMVGNDEQQGTMNSEEQWTTGNNEQWGTTNSREWQTNGSRTPPLLQMRDGGAISFFFLFKFSFHM